MYKQLETTEVASHRLQGSQCAFSLVSAGGAIAQLSLNDGTMEGCPGFTLTLHVLLSLGVEEGRNLRGKYWVERKASCCGHCTPKKKKLEDKTLLLRLKTRI